MGKNQQLLSLKFVKFVREKRFIASILVFLRLYCTAPCLVMIPRNCCCVQYSLDAYDDVDFCIGSTLSRIAYDHNIIASEVVGQGGCHVPSHVRSASRFSAIEFRLFAILAKSSVQTHGDGTKVATLVLPHTYFCSHLLLGCHAIRPYSPGRGGSVLHPLVQKSDRALR